ncbi:FAD binding domain-containing protein [Natronococcus wangiae]|uniref:FAD binding domain-containing protein n=1 Tax=Natronococcus wangiae TaxID=3068275 RepID=UPI00273F7B77|nr:FAD-dependent monooxygenase [Natronococcus sp. AD5]
MSQTRSHRTANSLEVAISGGSMGGLFAGIALERAGHDVTIYERSTGELRSRGAGIVAQQHVRRFLERHDIVVPEEITTASSERRFLARDGDVRASRPDSMVFTSWDAVYRRLRDAFPDDRYRMGAEVVDVAPETATATIAGGSERVADLVVAAEGGQSSTRRRLFPEVEPKVADYVAWRGVVPESDLATDTVEAFDDRFVFYQGSNLLILAYLIPGADGGTEPGERRLNWVWYDTLADRDRTAIFTDASDTERAFTVPPGRLRDPVRRRQLERAANVLPPVFETVAAETEAPFVQAIYDLAVPEMTVERACLLGDAAFVARPHTAAGTAKAAGDGAELANALEENDSPDAALSSWDETRTEYGSRLVARGKRMGDERLHLATRPS